MMPPLWVVIAHRDSESHDTLCDAMIDDYGFILINGDSVFEVLGAVPIADDSWRWTLRAPRACEWSIDGKAFVAAC